MAKCSPCVGEGIDVRRGLSGPVGGHGAPGHVLPFPVTTIGSKAPLLGKGCQAQCGEEAGVRSSGRGGEREGKGCQGREEWSVQVPACEVTFLFPSSNTSKVCRDDVLRVVGVFRWRPLYGLSLGASC